MSTDNGVDTAPPADGDPAVRADEAGAEVEPGAARAGRRRGEPRRRRDHPVATPLAGFFTGVAAVILVLLVVGALLSAVFDSENAERLFPFSAVVLAVPLVLLVPERTRRFARYMLLGLVLTLLVVLAAGAATVWFLIEG